VKIPHFSIHHKVNACVKLLLESYHGEYLWLNHRITVDPMLINQITGLSMQSPDPHDYYPGKTTDHALSQKIKEAYGDVEKGTRRYKVASIESGAVHLACQLIARKLVHKNQPTQVSGFVVDLARKCVEGLQMNWAKYLVNQLEIDWRESQGQGHEFYFSWILILISFVAWELPEGTTFLNIDPFEPLTVNFSTLWYSNDMNKQWKSNVIFHTYYAQLRLTIHPEPRMTLNTLHRFRHLIKFRADHHFIYITTHVDENKEQLQSYYKLTEEDLEEITKEWSTNLLILANPTELSDIDIPEAMQNTLGPSKTKKTKKTKKDDEIQYVDNRYVRTVSITPEKGGNGKDLEEFKHRPGDEVEIIKKRKGSPLEPSSRKKSKAPC
jgi:hypothetical protein